MTADAAPNVDTPTASALTLVAREDIARRHPLRLIEMLEDVPGVGRLEEGHSVMPSLRGSARGRTVILIDGRRVTTERRAGPSATYLDPFSLEGVEVSSSPGSVAYGSNARGVSGRGLVTGNPDLDPETSQQYDLAIRYARRG